MSGSGLKRSTQKVPVSDASNDTPRRKESLSRAKSGKMLKPESGSSLPVLSVDEPRNGDVAMKIEINIDRKNAFTSKITGLLKTEVIAWGLLVQDRNPDKNIKTGVGLMVTKFTIKMMNITYLIYR